LQIKAPYVDKSEGGGNSDPPTRKRGIIGERAFVRKKEGILKKSFSSVRTETNLALESDKSLLRERKGS